jgi:exonuclease III
VDNIINIYAPCNITERCNLLESLKHIIPENSLSELIICGDFNTCLNQSDCFSGNKGKSNKLFNKLITYLKISDTWKYKP